MSTATIDYGKLADQARASQTVEYALLADQARQQGEQKGFLQSAYETSPLSVLSAIAHPVDAATGIVHAIKQTLPDIHKAYVDLKARGWSDDEARHEAVRAVPIIGPVAAQFGQDVLDKNYAGAAGTLVGAASNALAPKAFKAAPEVAGETAVKSAGALQSLGESTQKFAVKRINKTVGLLQADFDHGATAGKQYLEQGFGASRSMDSIATKADTAIRDVGSKLSDAYAKASENMPEMPPGEYSQPQLGTGTKNALPGAVAKQRIPVQTVFDAVVGPLKNAHELESGFGGSGAVEGLRAYADRMAPEFERAVQRGGFTPKELFDLKEKLTKNINWKSTSDLESKLNNVREAQYGAITSILNDAVPELRPLNKAYGDLQVLKKRAQLRAKTGSTPLTNFKEQGLFASGGAALGTAVMGPGAGTVVGGLAGLAADSLPAKTGIASTLYNGGKMLTRTGSKLEEFLRVKQ